MAYDGDASNRLTVRMPESLRHNLEVLAEAADVPVSTFSRQLIERALEDGTVQGNAVDRLMEAEAMLAEARAKHVLAQARRVELENELIENGLPLPGEGSRDRGMSLVVVAEQPQITPMSDRPLFGHGPGRMPFKELPPIAVKPIRED